MYVHEMGKTIYFLNEHGIAYTKIKDGSNIFHTIMVPQTLQCYILYDSHNTFGHYGSTQL